MSQTSTITVEIPRDDAEAGGSTGMDMQLWAPDQPPRAAMLVIQEIFGVGSYIRAVAERLAGLGYLVGAPDVFWRFAPHWETGHDEAGLAASFQTVQQLDVGTAISDCVAALDALRRQPGIAAAPGVIGFCLGGTLAWGVALAAEPGVCISYYGSGVAGMLDRLDDLRCPTLLHFGNNDQYIPAEAIDAITAAIAGRPELVINVERAGHAFDNHDAPMFYEEGAAKAAWAKTTAFLASHVPA